MKPLQEALAEIAAGWNGRYEITDRARVMAAHARAGNLHRAEEYAAEIDKLQAAEDRRGCTRPPAPRPEWATCEWKLGYTAWAEILVHGWRCQRRLWASDTCTAADVVSRARYRFSEAWMTEADVIPPTAQAVAA